MGDRLVTDVSQLKSTPEETKIVILDDWTLSGAQIGKRLTDLLTDPRYKAYEKSIEVDLVAASRKTIQTGFELQLDGRDGDITRIPVRSYFMAHDAEIAGMQVYDIGATHITGSHSSTDRGFGDELGSMVKKGMTELPLPALANTVRPYRPEAGRAKVVGHVALKKLSGLRSVFSRQEQTEKPTGGFTDAEIEEFFKVT